MAEKGIPIVINFRPNAPRQCGILIVLLTLLASASIVGWQNALTTRVRMTAYDDMIKKGTAAGAPATTLKKDTAAAASATNAKALPTNKSIDTNENEFRIPCTLKNGTSILVSATQFWEQKGSCTIGTLNSVQFFHLGKGGGGSIYFLLQEHHLSLKLNHPLPEHTDQLVDGPSSTLLLNIRDPVDRFISAFNWRALLMCKVDDERVIAPPKNKGDKKISPISNPNEACFDRDTYCVKENRLIHDQLHDDINNLAEALCDDSDGYESAVIGTKLIKHATTTLYDWLEFLIDPAAHSEIKPQGIQKLMAIISEKLQYNNSTKSLLEWHTEQAIQELFLGYGLTEDEIELLLKYKPQLSKQDQNRAEKEIHSSTKSVESSNNNGPPPLNKLGECCLTRFLEKDYRLIRAMLPDAIMKREENDAIAKVVPLENVHPLVGTACSWGSLEQRQSCKAGLESMLGRRAPFLDQAVGSCREMVSNMNFEQ